MFNFGDHLTVNNIIALIFGIIGLIWLIYGIWRNWKINRASNWPTMHATIVSSYVEPVNSCVGSRHIDPTNIIPSITDTVQYVPKITFKYEISGTEYQSDKIIYYGMQYFNASSVKTLMNKLTPGSSIMIHYNPNNYSDAYIYNGTISYVGIIAGIILLLIAGYLGYYHYSTMSSKGIGSLKECPNLTEIETKIKQNEGGRSLRHKRIF